MAFTPDITTTTPVSTFSLVTTRATSSIRSDSAKPLDNPRVITISHDTQANGKVSSAIIIDDAKNVSSLNVTTSSNVRVMLKVQYNPLEGRSDLDTVVSEVIGQLKEILNSSNINRLLNKEH